jgi:capsular polysaccharide transport system permease protein
MSPRGASNASVPTGSALRRYRQVLAALFLREEQSRRQAPFETIIALLEPIFMIALLSFVWYYLSRRQVAPTGGSTVMFHAIGFFPMYFFIYLSRNIRASSRVPQRRFPTEQRLDLILVYSTLRTIDFAILGVLLFGGLYFVVTVNALPVNPASIAEACICILLLSFGFGVVNLILGRLFWVWGYINGVVLRAIMLFSGVFFVPDFMPPDLRYQLSFNPLLHAILLFKLGFNPPFPALILDRPYLWTVSIGTFVFALMVERLTRRYEGR